MESIATTSTISVMKPTSMNCSKDIIKDMTGGEQILSQDV